MKLQEVPRSIGCPSLQKALMELATHNALQGSEQPTQPVDDPFPHVHGLAAIICNGPRHMFGGGTRCGAMIVPEAELPAELEDDSFETACI